MSAADGPAACPGCGGTDFEDGFVDDMSRGNGRVRWLAGTFREGLFGGSKGRGIGRGRPVIALRCTSCSRLELYAGVDESDPYGI